MLLLITILGAVFVVELVWGLIPIRFLTSNKTLCAKIKHNNGLKETKRIKVEKKARNMKYIITNESESYVQVDKGKIFIHYPYEERLYNKRYVLEGGTSVRFRGVKPRFLLTFLVILIFASVFIGGRIYIKRELIPTYTSAVYSVSLSHDYQEYIDYEAYKGIHNYLIVGSDARDGMQTPHADVMLLISINENTKKMNVCSLLRDTYIDMQDKSTIVIDDLDPSLPNYEYLSRNASKTQWIKAKLNYAVNLQNLNDTESHTDQEYYAEGLNSLVNCIEYNFRMPITGVINISWTEFIKAIDILGGIDIEITEEMLITQIDDDHAYGIIPVLNNQNSLYNLTDQFDKAGIQHLNGNKALAYVRLRYIVGSTNSDVERTGRIRSFVVSLIKQQNIGIIKLARPKSIEFLASGIYSSLSEEELCELVDLLLFLPSPTDCGSLPYKFHDYTSNNVRYIAVDGKHEPRLDIQAPAILCN